MTDKRIFQRVPESYRGALLCAVLLVVSHAEIEIRIYRTNSEGDAQFLHSKCYIFEGADEEEAFVKVSDFIENGMGD